MISFASTILEILFVHQIVEDPKHIHRALTLEEIKRILQEKYSLQWQPVFDFGLSQLLINPDRERSTPRPNWPGIVQLKEKEEIQEIRYIWAGTGDEIATPQIMNGQGLEILDIKRREPVDIFELPNGTIQEESPWNRLYNDTYAIFQFSKRYKEYKESTVEIEMK